jgi:hypothetical protein
MASDARAIPGQLKQRVEDVAGALEIVGRLEQRNDALRMTGPGKFLQQFHREHVGRAACHRDHVGAERLAGKRRRSFKHLHDISD